MRDALLTKKKIIKKRERMQKYITEKAREGEKNSDGLCAWV